ncbi:hypothetical protein GCM10022286_06370 [Gryllotalpicola daejeonensis]|uniref:HTH luxR-type domain-containing protein n=1 Tax=Gryllotalpicola daejeonensis TaxID=993087 RepID=A0ABP7ZIK7_9MICO
MLSALREHLSNAEIAARLSLSVRTVESHVSSLLRKLNAADRRELAARSMPGSTPPPRLVRPPVQWTSFVGRERDRAELIDALERSRVVTVLGPGGMGKTRLAAAVATEMAPDLPGGAVWVDLVSSQPESALQAVAAALEVREEPDRALRELVLDRLGAQPLLLVLDNCEQLIDAVAEFVSAALAACPWVTVLATSRRRLDIRGERVVALPPLAPDDAVRLFLERAGSDEMIERPAVEEICRRLEAMPLPIELAAARVASLGVPAVLAALDDSLDFLSRGQSVDGRHSSVRGVLDWSFRLLRDDERAVFVRLGAFADQFDLEAVAEVAGVEAAAAAGLLGRLVDHSLVVRVHTAAGTRWRMLELVRAYAAEQLELTGETGEAQLRHARWAAASAVALERRLAADDPAWRAELDVLVDELRAVRDRPAASDEWHVLVPALAHLLYASGFLAEARETYLSAAEHAPADREAIDALMAAADIALAEFHVGGAFDDFLRAADVAERAGDGVAQAESLARAVITATRLAAGMPRRIGDERLAELVDAAQRALPPGEQAAAAVVAQARASMLIRTRRAAEEGFEESALAAARRSGDPLLISGVLDILAMRDLGRGALRSAYEHTAARVEVLRAVERHDPRGAFELTDLFRMLTEVGLAVGVLAETLRELEGFRRDAAVITPRQRTAESALPLALAGRFDQALDAAAHAWAEWKNGIGRPPRGLEEVAYGAALVHGLRGDDGLSSEWFERGDRVERAIGHDPEASDVRRYCAARIALARDDAPRAVAILGDVLSDPAGWHHPRPDFTVDRVYVWSLAAEAAVLAARPSAAAELEVAAQAAHESDWTAGYVARARGRLTGDRSALEASVAIWERMGARYERACTLLLLPSRADEGRRELAALGCG